MLAATSGQVQELLGHRDVRTTMTLPHTNPSGSREPNRSARARPLAARLLTLPAMPKPLTADDIVPLVKHLTLPERARLIRLIGAWPEDDAAAYRSLPPRSDEFSNDDEQLAWDAEGWEKLG
jgi:hypothetical protein